MHRTRRPRPKRPTDLWLGHSRALKGIQSDTQSNLHPPLFPLPTLRDGGLDTKIGFENMGGRFSRAKSDENDDGRCLRRPRRDSASYRNLQRRLPAPAKGNGRLQVQIRRCFIVCGPIVSSSRVYDWCFARDRRRAHSQAMRWSVRRILDAACERVGRAPTIGRPWLWRLKGAENQPSRLPGAYRAESLTDKLLK